MIKIIFIFLLYNITEKYITLRKKYNISISLKKKMINDQKSIKIILTLEKSINLYIIKNI